jgi:DNA-binding transcriptional LysR family regulator
MQNLEPILIFITVAEMGSFTRAADSLGIQKGRASTAVRKLEVDVGVRLLLSACGRCDKSSIRDFFVSGSP